MILVGFVAVSQQPGYAKDSVETSGDVLAVMLPTVAYGSTFYMEDEEGRIAFYKSFFSTLAVTQGLKYSVKKTRPDVSDNKSFPSGHSSASFQAASFIQRCLMVGNTASLHT